MDSPAILSGAFYGCSRLESVDLGDRVKQIGGGTFTNCSSLREITIPASVDSVNVYAFCGCSSLAKFDIADRSTKLSFGEDEDDPYKMLSDCPLEEVYIGGDITYPIKSRSLSPFYGSRKLRSVVISDMVTNIGYKEFYGCHNLQYVEIGPNVGTIDYVAFGECGSIMSMTCKNPNPPVCEVAALDGIKNRIVNFMFLNQALTCIKQLRNGRNSFILAVIHRYMEMTSRASR